MRNWWSWLDLARPGRRVLLSFPMAKGFTLHSFRAGAQTSSIDVQAADFPDSLSRWRTQLNDLYADGLVVEPRPRVFTRERSGTRDAYLVRWPTSPNVQWAHVPWDSPQQLIPWKTDPRSTMAEGLVKFHIRCAAGAKAGFTEWLPQWPEGFEAFLEPGRGFTERSSVDANGVVTRRWFDAPSHPETGAEMHVKPDNTIVNLQMDEVGFGTNTSFDAHGTRSTSVLEDGKFNGFGFTLDDDRGAIASDVEGGSTLSGTYDNRPTVKEAIRFVRGEKLTSFVHQGEWSYRRVTSVPCVEALLDGPPSVLAFRTLCAALMEASREHIQDGRRFCTELAPFLQKWPAEVRLHPPGWVQALVSGALPVEALTWTRALRLFDVFIDESTWLPVTDAKAACAALTTWAAALPAQKDFAQDGIDFSPTAWRMGASDSNVIRPRLDALEVTQLSAVLNSPLCQGLRWLNFSVGKPYDWGITHSDVLLDDANRVYPPDDLSWEALGEVSCARTLEVLLLRGTEVQGSLEPAFDHVAARWIEQRAEKPWFPALRLLDVGHARSPGMQLERLRQYVEFGVMPALIAVSLADDLTPALDASLEGKNAFKGEDLMWLQRDFVRSPMETDDVKALLRSVPDTVEEIAFGDALPKLKKFALKSRSTKLVSRSTRLEAAAETHVIPW